MNIGVYATIMTLLGLLAIVSLFGAVAVLRPVKVHAFLWQFRPQCVRELNIDDRKRANWFYLCIACWFVSISVLSVLAMKLSDMI